MENKELNSNVNNVPASTEGGKTSSKHNALTVIGNILWVILGGLIFSVLSFAEGIACCITLLLIPVGVQHFKLAKFLLWPMGKEIVEVKATNFKAVVNIIWAIFFGWELALFYLILGCVFWITIIGIPFGKQYFKIARFVLTPLGYSFVRKDIIEGTAVNVSPVSTQAGTAEAGNNPVASSFKNHTTKELMEFKKLLDMGVITQEEYEVKKKELLNL